MMFFRLTIPSPFRLRSSAVLLSAKKFDSQLNFLSMQYVLRSIIHMSQSNWAILTNVVLCVMQISKFENRYYYWISKDYWAGFVCKWFCAEFDKCVTRMFQKFCVAESLHETKRLFDYILKNCDKKKMIVWLNLKNLRQEIKTSDSKMNDNIFWMMFVFKKRF